MKKLFLSVALFLACWPARAYSVTAAGTQAPATARSTAQPRASVKPPRVGSKGNLIRLAPDIDVYAALVRSGRDVINVWTYLPVKRAKGAKLPLVLIAPAGTSLYNGMGLGSGDMPEHLPYVRAGFAVVTYEIAGALPENPTVDDQVSSATATRYARFGVRNAQSALDLALRQFPIDKQRIYAAGHSSAGTVALVVGAKDPRVRAIISYAPVTDVEDYLGTDFISMIEAFSPGYRSYIRSNSPINLTRSLNKPVFLFHADDDSRVTLDENAVFWNKLRKTNKRVTFARVTTGEHYQSMIDRGIPLGIAWLNKIK